MKSKYIHKYIYINKKIVIVCNCSPFFLTAGDEPLLFDLNFLGQVKTIKFTACRQENCETHSILTDLNLFVN